VPRLAAIVVLAVAAATAACGPRSGPPAPISHGGESRPALSRSEAASGIVIVQPGDTLYAVARRTGAPVRALIDTNRLQAPYRIQAGQRLQIPHIAAASARPSTVASSGSTGPTVAAVPRGGVESAPIAPPPSVTGAPLAGNPASPQVSTLPPSTPSNLPVVMPPPPAPGTEAAIATPATPVPTASASPQSPPAVGESPAPQPAPGPAAPPPGASSSAPASSDEITPQARDGRFLWPVRGNIISTFGTKPGGLQNDGINIAAPRGTPVRATENGVVVYAGNELKGFGNLLLLRHADGWMSAYAHLDAFLVERGATVKRGQNVARVGQTGSVATPQLHFELRRGGRAVDPRGQLAPLQTATAN
jgi:murein DD-endopeptidase MepM/ murein hydrolase activator NlpD